MNEKLDSEQYANWKAPEFGEQIATPESSVDFVEMGKLFSGGSAGEYMMNVGDGKMPGPFPVEAVFESQGKETVWPDVDGREKPRIRDEFSATVNKYNGLKVVEDETSLMAVAA